MSFPGAGDQVDELADATDVEARPGVCVRNHAAHAGTVDLDEVHRMINELADLWLLGRLIEVLSAGFRCHPEHALSSVFVAGLEELLGRVAGDPSAASSLRGSARRSSIASTTSLRKIGPRTVCLYADAPISGQSVTRCQR
jgi:hypothetical protein